MIQADLIITNANILTLDEYGTRAGSLAVFNGRITGIWKESEPLRNEIHYTSKVRKIDLQGATLIPGFIDTHNHLLMYAQYRQQVDCSSAVNRNISDIQMHLKTFKEKTEKGKWMIGFGYDDTMLEEKRHPTRNDLDMVSTEHPIFIRHVSGHLAVANTMALRLAGLDHHTPQPSGGHLGKDPSGELNGVLYEPGAMDLVFQHIPKPTDESLVHLLKEASADYLKVGITTNTDAAVGFLLGPKELDVHIEAIKQKANPMRMRFMIPHQLLGKGTPFEKYTAEELNREILQKTDEKAKLDSVKIFQDGSIQGLTGALRQSYFCDNELYGDLIFNQDQLNELALDFHKRGFRIATHGNGDRAIGSIIEAYEFALQHQKTDDHRHRIEHVQTATPEDLRRMKQLGIAASFFINHVYYWGDRHKHIFLGSERAERISPLGDAMDLELLFTLHSDCPITPISPLFSVWAAVNRITRDGNILGADQRIDVETALKSMTIYGAQLNFEEDESGSIEVGKQADFAVLGDDPTKVNSIVIKDIPVLATIIGGEIVYQEEESRIIANG